LSGLFVWKAALEGTAFCFLFFTTASLLGCTSIDRFGGSRQTVIDWSRDRGFVGTSHTLSGGLQLLSLQRINPDHQVDALHVYIEGDGAAWPNPYHPPLDPTPLQPTALALAAADRGPAVAYLGRPCQYLDVIELAACSPQYWTNRRFAPEVIAAYMEMLDRLKVTSSAGHLRLIGYSGGGVVATLLATRRDDVEQLVTVASPLAVAEWATWHKMSPLRGSLDPINEALTGLPPATHFVGERDSVVPARIVSLFAGLSGGRLHEVPDFDHQCCWVRDWQQLLEDAR